MVLFHLRLLAGQALWCPVMLFSSSQATAYCRAFCLLSTKEQNWKIFAYIRVVWCFLSVCTLKNSLQFNVMSKPPKMMGPSWAHSKLAQFLQDSLAASLISSRSPGLSDYDFHRWTVKFLRSARSPLRSESKAEEVRYKTPLAVLWGSLWLNQQFNNLINKSKSTIKLL